MEEYKMYGIVPFNLSMAQKGIQFQHATQRYNNKFLFTSHYTSEQYNAFEHWALKDETSCLLQCYGTNDYPDSLGHLNTISGQLTELGVLVSEFREPALNNSLTAICFLLPKVIWDRRTYPNPGKHIDYDGIIKHIESGLPDYTQGIPEVEAMGGVTNFKIRRIIDSLPSARP